MLADQNKDILTYASNLAKDFTSKGKGEPDGAIIVMISALLKRPISLVYQKGTWSSELSDNHDIVLGYSWHNIYMPSQVGIYIFINFLFI